MNKINAFLILILLIFPSVALSEVEKPDSSKFVIDATSSKIYVQWEANTNVESDAYDNTEGYYIKYWKTDDESTIYTIDCVGVESESETITGLESGVNYTINFTAYSGTLESSVHEETITTDSIDADNVDIVITGVDEITISIDAEGSNIDTYSVTVETSIGGTEIYTATSIDIEDSLAVSGLTAGEAYSVVVSVTPDTADFPVTIPFEFESTHTFLSDAENDIENGCFIGSSIQSSSNILFYTVLLVIGALFLSGRSGKIGSVLLVLFILAGPVDSFAGESFLYKNYFGIKGGLFLPNESEQKDVYEEIVPFSIFYERILTDHFSFDLDLGYSKSDGKALATSSSSSTELVTELEMYPAAASINFNYDVAPYMTAYIGLGGDWWVVEEKSEIGEFDSEVGGWHAKTGLKVFSDELETLKQVGCLLDISYTEIDRFGNNDIDLGGWKFNIGLFYCL